jgi:hypothetical protein
VKVLCKKGSFLLQPRILLHDLLLLLRGERLLDAKGLSNFVWGLPLDHVRHRLASEVQKRFDVKVVCGQDEIKESGLVNLAEFGVPRDNVVTPSLLFFLVNWVYYKCIGL